jgi:hypothetical protein
MLMSVLGGIGESERQHVRAAMDAQVVNEGAFTRAWRRHRHWTA